MRVCRSCRRGNIGSCLLVIEHARVNAVIVHVDFKFSITRIGSYEPERRRVVLILLAFHRVFRKPFQAGKISEAFWEAKSSEWHGEEQQILMALDALDRQNPEKLLDGVRILELANKAYFLYLRQPPIEKAKLLRIVLSNCKIDAARLDPTYRKPFDLIFQRVKNEEWLPGLDSN